MDDVAKIVYAHVTLTIDDGEGNLSLLGAAWRLEGIIEGDPEHPIAGIPVDEVMENLTKGVKASLREARS